MKNLLPGRLIIAALFTLTVMSGLNPAHAMNDAEKFVNDVAEKVLEAANKKSTAQFRAVFRKHADVAAISRTAAGRHGRNLTAHERKEVEKAVERMIAQAFTKYSNYIRGRGVEVTSSTRRSKRTIEVTTKILGGELDEIKWKIYKRGKSFRVVDMGVSGMWMSMQMRSKLTTKLKNARGDVYAALAD